MELKTIFQTYGIIKIEDLPNVDFSQVGESSTDTVRKNILNPPTQFLLKWDVEPSFISDGTIVPEGIYSHIDCLALMATEEWSEPDPEVEEI
jgi:hypothetical protein